MHSIARAGLGFVSLLFGSCLADTGLAQARALFAVDVLACEHIMNRPVIRITQRLSLHLLLGWAMTSLITNPLHAADSVCVYQSRSYSEGAFICVQKSLMQTCTGDGIRMVWRIVADKDISDRCVAPAPRAEPRKRIVRRTRIARQIAPPAQPSSAKCFVFNGKRYCE